MSTTVWRDQAQKPHQQGWYETMSDDDLWGNGGRCMAWNNGQWWMPVDGGWVAAPVEPYRWRGPVADMMAPAPDGVYPNVGLGVDQ